MSGVAQPWDFRRALRRMAARLRHDSRAGSAAIEFAMIAPVFFVLLMGTIEVGIMFFAQFTLQNAVDDEARQIRTGQVAASSVTQQEFRQAVCDKITPILGCDANLQIDVESYPSFGTANFTSPMTSSNTLDPNLNNFDPGTVCSVVLVRAFYTWNVVTPLLTPFMINMANNEHLITATAAFRNEPYNNTVSGC